MTDRAADRREPRPGVVILREAAEAGSVLAQLELAKAGLDPFARALLDLQQDRRRRDLAARIAIDMRRPE